MMKNILKVWMMLAVAFTTVSCYDDFDTPAPQVIYQDEDFADLELMTIREVKDMYIEVFGSIADHGSNGSWADTRFMQISSDFVDYMIETLNSNDNPLGIINDARVKEKARWEEFKEKYGSRLDNLYIKGKVQSSDEEGNVYKSIYVCDQTGAIEVKLGTGNYLNYPVGHFDPETGTMPSTYVYVKLKDLYIGNYRMMLSIGDAPSSSYNKCGEHKFYANSNIENPSTISKHVFLGEPTELSVAEGDILEITAANMNEIYCHAGNYKGDEEKALEVMGRLVWIKDVTCVYGEVDGNIYPSWMDTNVRPVVSKYWYNWGFNAKEYPAAANLYGSVLFTMDGKKPSLMGEKAGIYVVRSSGYARFAGKPIVRNGAKGHILGHIAIYGKYWADYATYQLTINRLEDIMFDEEDFITDEEADQDYFDRTGYHMNGYDENGEYSVDWDAYYTPSTEDSMEEGGGLD